MKVGDLVRMKNDDVLGIIMRRQNIQLETVFVTWGPCWQIFWFAYKQSISAWENELEVINESR